MNYFVVVKDYVDAYYREIWTLNIILEKNCTIQYLKKMDFWFIIKCLLMGFCSFRFTSFGSRCKCCETCLLGRLVNWTGSRISLLRSELLHRLHTCIFTCFSCLSEVSWYFLAFKDSRCLYRSKSFYQTYYKPDTSIYLYLYMNIYLYVCW